MVYVSKKLHFTFYTEKWKKNSCGWECFHWHIATLLQPSVNLTSLRCRLCPNHFQHALRSSCPLMGPFPSIAPPLAYANFAPTLSQLCASFIPALSTFCVNLFLAISQSYL